MKDAETVFSLRSVVANGDVLNPAMRMLIHQRMLGQFERILEMITEKMGLRVLGGVRRYGSGVNISPASLHYDIISE